MIASGLVPSASLHHLQFCLPWITYKLVNLFRPNRDVCRLLSVGLKIIWRVSIGIDWCKFCAEVPVSTPIVVTDASIVAEPYRDPSTAPLNGSTLNGSATYGRREDQSKLGRQQSF